MLDPDNDSAFTQTGREPRNYVKFYRQWVRNNFKSKEQGIEVGEHQDFIMIVSPGQTKTEVRRKASDADKHQYAQEFAAYEAGKEMQMSGTPIELLPGLASGMADALKAQYIYTIEQMATVSDMAMQKIGMGAGEIRTRAKNYLAGGSAELAALKAQLADATKLIEEMRAKMEEPKPTNRGPKPKKPASEPAVLQ